MDMGRPICLQTYSGRGINKVKCNYNNYKFVKIVLRVTSLYTF